MLSQWSTTQQWKGTNYWYEQVVNNTTYLLSWGKKPDTKTACFLLYEVQEEPAALIHDDDSQNSGTGMVLARKGTLPSVVM